MHYAVNRSFRSDLKIKTIFYSSSADIGVWALLVNRLALSLESKLKKKKTKSQFSYSKIVEHVNPQIVDIGLL